MIRVLVVDDEQPARLKLVKAIASTDGFSLAGEAEDGLAAVEAIRASKPDLVLLDLQMPLCDGFGVVAAVGVENMPLVVFVTAYDEHALEAFEAQAFDYVLKPFSNRRLADVLERVRGRVAEQAARQAQDQGLGEEDLENRLSRLLESVRPSQPAAYLQRLMAHRSPEREVFVAVSEIDWVDADGNYLVLHTARGSFRRRMTLKSLAGQLDPEVFLQINRSQLVRFDAVDELQPWFHGDYRVLLKDGTELSWSRRFRAQSKHQF